MKALALFSAVILTASRLVADDAWGTDLAKAQETAKKEKKMVLLDFTGSDWCPPCKAIHAKVLTSPEFTEFAKANLVLVELDFPKSKELPEALKAANKELATKYEIRGFPTIIVLDADGKEVFRKVGYGGTSAADYVAELAKLKK